MEAHPTTHASHPSGDHRFAVLDATIRRHGGRSDGLIEVLHSAQEQFGYLARDVLAYIARALDLPTSRVYGVATFYNFFTLEPRGRHRCVVCVGTACYVKAGAEVAAAVARELGVVPDSSKGDALLSLDLARCLGSCGQAPVVLLDEELLGKLDMAEILQRVRRWREDVAAVEATQAGVPAT